jgi:hypothetical protein
LIKSIPSGLGLINKHVITIDIATIFGNVNTFNTTNPLLSPDAWKEIKTLYWKIYGTWHITNNELMVWFVKGWIVEWNGHPINWAIIAIATIKEKLNV